MPTKVRRRTPADRHFADQAVTSPTTPTISVFIHDESINGKTNDGQHRGLGICGGWMVLFAVFAAMAETERENIRDATLEGLTAAARS